MELLLKYFPELNEGQKSCFAALFNLYIEWNSKINVISRKDIEHLYEHHVLHSLAIGKFIRFRPSTTVLDAGTGGGFPGIPLSILFPESSFLLVDSTGKKINVAQAIIDSIGLLNVKTRHCRIEEEKTQFDFVVSRAVATLPELVKVVRKNIRKEQFNSLPNGLISLKGGDIQRETSSFSKHIVIQNLSAYFKEAYFETKKLIYLPL
ncbi:MAG: 16S rRNA (guanine(527)-N(7))-methyltransferase RsmG [Tannerella sp.]|jgi:16S rRNA (guanine527-N7)-methyltransferase|nr:16S rRNA (guanine(527)-N(7))-methyltransferase RsmG [Tannerella sp.]